VDDAVVSAAEHHEIVDIGSAAVQPMPDMVYLAPEWGSVAAGMGAAAVTAAMALVAPGVTHRFSGQRPTADRPRPGRRG